MKVTPHNRTLVTAAFSGALVLGAAGMAVAATGANPLHRVHAEELHSVTVTTIKSSPTVVHAVAPVAAAEVVTPPEAAVVPVDTTADDTESSVEDSATEDTEVDTTDPSMHDDATDDTEVDDDANEVEDTSNSNSDKSSNDGEHDDGDHHGGHSDGDDSDHGGDD